MATSIVFKTLKCGEVIEEGFTTCFSPVFEDALSHVKNEIDLEDCDQIELTISKIQNL